jgi:peptide/nickel transport system permease protein
VNLRGYFIRRLLQMIPVILAVVLLTFALLQLAPGDVATLMAGEDADPQVIAAIRERYRLDAPVLDQFVAYIGSVLQGDLGTSIRYGQPVLDVILSRAPATLLLVGTALLAATFLGTTVGALLARRIGSRTDAIASFLAIGAFSVPVFWLGLMLILVFAVNLQWLPSSGMTSALAPRDPIGRALDLLAHLVLPGITLATVWFGQYLRLSRSSVASVLGEDYIAAARAAGFSERRILLHHALRNALLPVITVFGLQLGVVLAGAVLTETVFSWPGLGRLIYDAILARDVPLIVGSYLVMSVMVAVASLVTDLAYARLDPRVELR